MTSPLVAGITLNAIFFGIGLTLLRERGRVLFLVFDAIFTLLLKILLISVW